VVARLVVAVLPAPHRPTVCPRFDALLAGLAQQLFHTRAHSRRGPPLTA
jgi:hypothetical protein